MKFIHTVDWQIDKNIPEVLVMTTVMDCHGGPKTLWHAADGPHSSGQTSVSQIICTAHWHEGKPCDGALVVGWEGNLELTEVSYAK